MNILNQIDKVKSRVESLLKNKPALRDDDNRLIATIWFYESGGEDGIKNMSARDFLAKLAHGEYSSSESIRRSRAQLQHDNESLQGKKYAARQDAGYETSKGINKKTKKSDKINIALPTKTITDQDTGETLSFNSDNQ